MDSGYSRSTPFVQWVPRECSGLSLLTVQKKKLSLVLSPNVRIFLFFIRQNKSSICNHLISRC
ncbi:hypothetical protein Hanom_Chr16g01519861 [Helianthus anomalus]